MVELWLGWGFEKKLVKPGTSNFFIPIEDLFDKIHDAHIEKGHPGRDIMQKY